jgi:hypothetical protein
MFYLGEKGEPGLSGQPGSDGLPGPDVMNCFCGNKKKLNFLFYLREFPVEMVIQACQDVKVKLVTWLVLMVLKVNMRI